MYYNRIHARSYDSRNHPSRNWVKNFHGKLAQDIPEHMRICGENMYAKHSILYEQLTTYFYVFTIFIDEMCLSWDDTMEWCELLNLQAVPVLYRGPWNTEKVMSCWKGTSAFGDHQEGYVVRNAQSFSVEDFQANVAKFVRPNHVTTDEHWMNGPLIPNLLRE